MVWVPDVTMLHKSIWMERIVTVIRSPHHCPNNSAIQLDPKVVNMVKTENSLTGLQSEQ